MIDTSHNSSFSRVLLGLQLYWDSTSLNALKTCPRKYFYTIVCGYEPRQRSFHLDFGIWVHEAKEHYDRARAIGANHDDAVLDATTHLMCATWNRELARPWDSQDPNKNRFTLLRTMVWYFEEYRDDAVQTVIMANGKPAVELSFSFNTEFISQDGETFAICGHMDRLAELDGKTYVCDVKTTKYTLDERYFAQFSPHNQFTVYTLASKITYALPTSGLIVDAAQIAVSFSRFERRAIPRDPGQLDEWYAGFGVLVKQAEQYARNEMWPLNEEACGNYGGCAFRKICSRSPAVRHVWLKTDFTTRTWDPLQRRGDI